MPLAFLRALFPLPATKSRHALVCFTLPDYLIELYRETFKHDLSRINGDPS
jgi:hypothetical protein